MAKAFRFNDEKVKTFKQDLMKKWKNGCLKCDSFDSLKFAGFTNLESYSVHGDFVPCCIVVCDSCGDTSLVNAAVAELIEV
jgi:hypothetical protein